MEYIKKEHSSYNLHMIKTKKFKSTYVEIIFSNEISKKEITIGNFLSTFLVYSSKKYNSRLNYSKKMEELYGASIFSNCYRLGKFYNVDFNMRVLNDKYTEDGLLEKAFDFLYETIFNPNVKDNKFDETCFKVVKNNEKSQIERFMEDQRRYAGLRLFELFDKDSPMSYNLKGYLDDLNEITPENLFLFYKKFIKTNNIDIFIIGDIDFNSVEKIIERKFLFDNVKEKGKSPVIEWKNHRSIRQEIIEKDNTNQAKLSIACTIENMTKYEKDYVLNIYNIILGGSADSKFFKNIREKFSLCYYVVSNAYKLDNVLTISSGINKENYSKILILIDKEMNDMINGNFSDDDINNAKKYCISALEEIEDNPAQIIASYYAIDVLEADDIETRKEKINKVTKEEIMNFAKKIYIDTIFLLGGDKK